MVLGALYTVASGQKEVFPYAIDVSGATIDADAQSPSCVISGLASRSDGGFKIDAGDWLYESDTCQLRKINTTGNLNDPMATGTEWVFTVDPPLSTALSAVALKIIKASSVPKLWVVAEGWDGSKGSQVINPTYDANTGLWADTPFPFVGNGTDGASPIPMAWMTNTDLSGIVTYPVVLDNSLSTSNGAYASASPLGF